MRLEQDLTLRDMKLIHLLVEMGSVTEAADALGLSASQASRSLKELERAFGLQLFTRSKSGVRPTATGREIVPILCGIVDSVELAAAKARKIAAGEAGQIRLGYTTYSTVTALPGVLAALSTGLPEVELELVRGRDDDLERWIIQGEVDLALVHPPFDAGGIDLADLLFDPLAWIVPEGWRGPRPCPVSYWNGSPILVPPLSGWPLASSQFLERCQRMGLAPFFVESSFDAGARMALVAAKGGVSICGMARAKGVLPGVELIAIEGFEDIGYQTSLAWRAEDPLPAVHSAASVILAERTPRSSAALAS